MTHRWLHAAILLAVFLAVAPAAHVAPARYRYTAADTEAAMAEHSALAGCIVSRETGGTLEPYSVGAAGELGVAQLHPYGLLPEFYALGYGDPFSPYQAMDFLEGALARGEGPNWTTYWAC